MFRLFLSLFLLLAGGGGIAAASTSAVLASNLETSFTATYTQTSTTKIGMTGDAPEGSSVEFFSTGTANVLVAQKSMTYTISGYDGKTIEAITLSMHSNKDSGAGNLFIKIGERIIAEIVDKDYYHYGVGVPFEKWFDSGGYPRTYTDIHVSFREEVDLTIGEDEVVMIQIEATVNSLHCQSVSITWNNGSYTRGSLTAEKFGTICLDKGGVVKSGGTLYEIAYRDDSGIYMDEVTRMEAGVPYIFQATDTALVIAHDETTATEPINRNGLYGTFTEISDVAAVSTDKTEYVIVGGKICKCESNCQVPANRAYIVLTEVPTEETPVQQGRRRVGMSIQGENQTTAVENTMVTTREGVYDIMGRRLVAPTASGFYIINGEKVFVTN